MNEDRAADQLIGTAINLRQLQERGITRELFLYGLIQVAALHQMLSFLCRLAATPAWPAHDADSMIL